MTAGPAVQPMLREIAPASYDLINEQRYRAQVDEELLQKHDRRSDLRLGRGKSLVLSAPNGVERVLQIDDTGTLSIIDYTTGSVGTFVITWSQINGAAAIQTRIENLEAAASGLPGIYATISYVNTVEANLNSAIATSAATLRAEFQATDQNLQAQINNRATISQLNTVETSLTGSIASVQTNLSALSNATTNAQPNLIPNAGFANGAAGWALAPGAFIGNNFWGPHLVHPNVTGTQTSQIVLTENIFANSPYTLSADFVAIAGSGSVYCDVVWQNASGQTISTVIGPTAVLGQDFGNRRNAALTSPAGAARAVVRFVTESITSPVALQMRRIKLERGSVATAWSDERSLSSAFAEISDERSVRASADAALATSISIVRARTGGDGSPIPDWDYRDAGFWNIPAGASFVQGAPFPEPVRGISMPAAGYDYYSQYWRMESGATYEIKFRWHTNSSFAGWARPMLHIPFTMWQALRGNGANVEPAQPGGTQPGDVTTANASGVESYRYTIPNSVTQIQTRIQANITAGAFSWSLELKRLPQWAEVQQNTGAIATLNSSTAWLEQVVSASGGDLAAFRLRAGQGGSFIELISTVLRLANVSNGQVIEIMRAISGEAYFSRPISSDGGGRRVTIGPGYGVSGSQVVLWFGPDTTSPSSQSRTNGYFALGTDGKVYVGNAELRNAAVGARISTMPSYTGPVGANRTTSAAGLTLTGLSGTISYFWQVTDASGMDVVISNKNTAAPTFRLPTMTGDREVGISCLVTAAEGVFEAPGTARWISTS